MVDIFASKIRNLINSGIKGDFSQEALRKALLINMFSLIGLLFMVFFGIRSIMQGNHLTGWVDISFAGATLAILIYLRLTRNYKFAGWGIVLLLFALTLFLLVTDLGQGKLLWYYVFPLIAYFILGIKQGGIINILLFSITVVLLLFPSDTMPLRSESFIIRFISTYIAVSGLVHIFEFIRQSTYHSLMEANHTITEYLSHTVKQKQEIEKQTEKLELINLELKKLSAVVRQTDNAVMIVDRTGQVEWVNDAFTRLYGYNILDLNEMYNWDLIHAGFNRKMNEKIELVMHKKEFVNFESVVTNKNGDEIEVQTTLTPLYSEEGELTKFIIIDTDIRQLKDAERKLREVVAMKDKFFSIIAHDLKNPFNSIIGVSKLLAENPGKYDKDKLNFFHKSIYKVSKNSYDLLINLLEWSRAQAGTMELIMSDLNLYLTIKDTLQLVDSQAKEKNIEFNFAVDSNIEVRADVNTLRTVLRNLLTNAIKYSWKNSKIDIRASVSGDFVQVDIIDYGIGIPAEKSNKLFRIDKQFSRRGTNKEEGTGLGLVLCKEFIEKNGGEIWVNSEEGKGSVFSFTLQTTS